MTDPPGPVADVFAALPDASRARLLEMRALILEAEADTGTGPLTETLKWGEPSYLTEATKAGSTIRITWKPKDPENCGLYLNCQTDLVDRCRERFTDAFCYVGDRAVIVPVSGDFDRDALRAIAAMALTYHRDKRTRA